MTSRADHPLTDGGPSGNPEKEEVPAPRLDRGSKVACTRTSGEGAPGRERWKQMTPDGEGRGDRSAATTHGGMGGSRSVSEGGWNGRGGDSPSSSGRGGRVRGRAFRDRADVLLREVSWVWPDVVRRRRRRDGSDGSLESLEGMQGAGPAGSDVPTWEVSGSKW